MRIHDEGSKLRKRFAHKDVADTIFVFDGSSPSTPGQSQSTDSSPEESLDLVLRGHTPDLTDCHDESDQWLSDSTSFAVLPEFEVLFGNASPFDALPNQLSGGMINLDRAFRFALNDGIFSPHLMQEQLLDTFSSALSSNSVLRLPRQMRNHQNWLAQLPARFGSNLLDTAIRAVSLIHLGRSRQSHDLVQESRQFYGNALQLLNKALSNDMDGMSTDTLSATVLLSFYEMFASNSNQAWVRHSGGAGLLMRIRGPTRHLNGLDRDVYLAYRHTIVIDAFMRDEACFLAEPAWLEMAHKVHEDLRATGVPEERMEIFDLAEDFYLEHVHIPRTIRDARFMDKAKRAMSPEEFDVHRESVLARAQLHRANLKSINLRFRANLKRMGLQTLVLDTRDPIVPKQYVFANVFVASTHTGHWTIMLMLNLVLKSMEKDFAPEKNALYVMENREMCGEICRTTPFMMTSSFLGPFFVIFALRLCLMILEPGQERTWVVAKLREIGSTHMSMAADIPAMKADMAYDKPTTPYKTRPILEETF